MSCELLVEGQRGLLHRAQAVGHRNRRRRLRHQRVRAVQQGVLVEWQHRTLRLPAGEQLADRLYRYRMMSIAKAYPVRKVGAEHTKIFQAVLAKQSDEAVLLLQRHYQRTADIIYSDIEALLA